MSIDKDIFDRLMEARSPGDLHRVCNGVISEDGTENGYILACCSKPIGCDEIEA